MENKILPIVHLILKLTKTHPLFYTFAKNTAAVFLLVVKMAAPRYYLLRMDEMPRTHSKTVAISNVSTGQQEVFKVN